MPFYQYECNKHRFEQFHHRKEDRYDAVCPECGETGTLIMAPVRFRTARPFTVYDHDGTILHQRQTIEKTPPPGYRYENPNLVEV